MISSSLGLRVLREQCGRAHQHPRRAVAALEPVVVAEGLLERRSARRRRRAPRPSSIFAPSAWTASSMQLFTASPSRCTVHAPQLPVSQPMCVPVRSRSSRMKWTSRRRAVDLALVASSPLTSTAIVLLVDRLVARHPLALSAACRTARTATPRRGGGGSRREAWTSAGGSSVAPRPATAARTPPRRVAPASAARSRSRAPASRRRSRARSAAPPADRRGRVDDAGAVRAERDRRASRRRRRPARGTRDLRQQLALADGGHVDAEEELLGGDRALAAGARGSSTRAPSATSSGGRWFVGSFEQTLPPIVPRLRTWTSAIVRGDLGEDRPGDLDLGRAR